MKKKNPGLFPGRIQQTRFEKRTFNERKGYRRGATYRKERCACGKRIYLYSRWVRKDKCIYCTRKEWERERAEKEEVKGQAQDQDGSTGRAVEWVGDPDEAESVDTLSALLWLGAGDSSVPEDKRTHGAVQPQGDPEP